MKCKFCDKEFNSRHAFAIHLAVTEKFKFKSSIEKEKYIVDSLYGEEIVNITIDKYLAQEVCCNDLYIRGPDIIKYLTLLGIKRSSKEERKTLRYKHTYLDGIQRVYGTDITNISQVPDVKNKKIETAILNYGSYDTYLAEHRDYMKRGYNIFASDNNRVEEMKKKQRKTCLIKYGYENFGRGVEAQQKAHSTRSKTIAGWDHEERLKRTSAGRAAVCSRGGYESSIERRVQHCLVDMGISFTTHFHKWHYNYDLLLEDHIIIEVQGDMWHATPLKYKETDLIMGKLLVGDIWKKDAKKKAVAESSGYKIVYIWEHEIVKIDNDKLIKLLLHKIQEYKNESI